MSRRLTFRKPSTTLEDQFKRLADRGMKVEDSELAKRWLSTVSYYRLGAYWLAFEETPSDGQTRSRAFKAGTQFEDIIDLYVFDRKLRLLVTEAIERNEIALRCGWVYELANAHGPHCYLDATLFDFGLGYAKQLAKLEARVAQSNETFIKHYLGKYDRPVMPPLWAVSELMTLGELSQWVAHTRDRALLKRIASGLGLPTHETMTGTFEAFSYVRNICAHHGRLWNRALVKRPPVVKRYRHSLVMSEDKGSGLDNRMYNVLVLLIALLNKQSPDTSYRDRLLTLLTTRTADQLRQMGFPKNWQTKAVWS